jgi:hypothetical protein
MIRTPMTNRKRIFYPIGAGLIGAALLTIVYFGIISWAESPKHAVEFFWLDRWIVIPIILGFGVQTALYAILKLRLFLPMSNMGPSGPMALELPASASVGASGTTSTIAMVSCCAHHVTDVLPILGLTAAATFLAKYRLAFMDVGLGTTLLSIGYMLFILIRERRKAMQINSITLIAKETS